MKIQVFDIDIPGSVAAGEATAKEQRCAWLVRNDPEATPKTWAELDAICAKLKAAGIMAPDTAG